LSGGGEIVLLSSRGLLFLFNVGLLKACEGRLHDHRSRKNAT
jgi:hypothetical protein